MNGIIRRTSTFLPYGTSGPIASTTGIPLRKKYISAPTGNAIPVTFMSSPTFSRNTAFLSLMVHPLHRRISPMTGKQFKVVSPYKPSGDQEEAISHLSSGIHDDLRMQTL